MVKGVNDIGESSEYLYNGLGALVTNTWIIKKNAYGYHDVQIDAVVEGETVVDTTTNTKTKKAKKSAEEVAASEELNKSSTVVKEFVVDYNTETFEPLMEHEVNGLDYKYVYGNDRLSVDITSVTNSMSIVENGDHVRLYYHMDYLGTADYLTSPVSLKVTSWTHYNEWGEITHNAVLKCGQRELDLVKRYATHDYDNVLDLYYAKARFYDADNRRFVAVDPILNPSQYDIREYVDNPMQIVQYLYVVDNPVILIDKLGLIAPLDGTLAHLAIETYVKSLDSKFESNVPLLGVYSTPTGFGVADLVKENRYSVDVYEIKPISWKDKFPLDFFASVQVNSYIYAINNHRDLNPEYGNKKARLGTAILSKIDGKIIPFPGDSNRYIKIYTYPFTRPGMIYYSIFGCKEKKPEYDYVFSPEEEKTWKNHLRKAESYDYSTIDGYSIFYDSIYDVYYANNVNKWVESITTKTVTFGNTFVFTQVSYPDGKTMYNYEGLTIQAPKKRVLTDYQLMSIYSFDFLQTTPGTVWRDSPPAALIGSHQYQGAFVIPSSVPIIAW